VVNAFTEGVVALLLLLVAVSLGVEGLSRVVAALSVGVSKAWSLLAERSPVITELLFTLYAAQGSSRRRKSQLKPCKFALKQRKRALLRGDFALKRR
jgi:hypothetical protein